MSKTSERAFRFRPKLIAVSVAVCFAMNAPQVLANPTGATVMSGTAGFAPVGNTLTVTNSANAIINWQGFSIGLNEITRFVQPSAASAVLNRVVGANGVIPQSVIDGMLSSNGRVFLLNPTGVVINATARIDVAGFVGSSLALSDQDFLSGKLRFTEVAGAGAVVNHGVIETNAPGGRVFLVAPEVENSGIIRAPQGEIVLAAGKSADLVSESMPYVSVRVVADTEQALNVGSLIADSGRIGMYGALLRNSGVAEANGATLGAGGQIRFVATKDLTIDAGSRISANGTSGGQIVLQAEGGTNLIAGKVEATGNAGKGGTVEALGVRVGVVGKGVIDASGETGGGTVLVGGDYQGKNKAVQNAQRTLIGTNGVIRADARNTGDGGRVIVWSDGDTGFYGTISARGGSQSGNGGFVETSSKGTLQAFGNVDVSSPKGKGGTWLLDPTDISIVAGVTSVYGACDDPSTGSICFGDPPSTSNVGLANINAALSLAVSYGGGTVQMQATRDINVQTDVILTPSGGLVIAEAGNNINFGAHNLVTNGTAVRLTANANPHSSGYGSITSTPGFGNITTNGAWVDLSGVGVAVGAINTTGGSGTNDTFVTISANGGSISTGSIATGNTTSDYSYVSLNANGGSVSTGSITTGNAGYDSSVEIFAGSSITTGSIATGNAGTYSNVIVEGNSNVTLGNITTGNAGWDSSVEVYTGDGSGSIVTGSITTGSAGFRSNVDLEADASVSTGNITTGNAGSDTSVNISANNGSATTGNIQTGSITDGSEGGSTYVSIYAGLGNIVTGSITTGNAIASSCCYGGSASANSYVQLRAPNGTVSTQGIQTGSAVAFDGGEGGGGGGSAQSYVQIASKFNVVTGSITTGLAVASNSSDTDSYVSIEVDTGGINTGAIVTGVAVDGFSYVSLMANSPRTISTGDITTGGGGLDSSVFISDPQGAITTGSINTGSASFLSHIHVYGGGDITTAALTAGPSSFSDVLIQTASGNITTGSMTTHSSQPYYGGAVRVRTDNGSILVKGIIDTHGTDMIGKGGDGGDVELRATDKIEVGPKATFGIFRVVINSSGGNGLGAEAYGGNAGHVMIDPQNIQINGIIQATGGTGSFQGGSGGDLDLLTFNKAGFIDFYNGGFDVTGAAGLLSNGKVTTEGTLRFFFVQDDALNNPEVVQALNQLNRNKFGSCKAT